MERHTIILPFVLIIILMASCKKDEPVRYSTCDIKESIIHYSDTSPSNSLREDRPHIINTIQEYDNLLQSWNLTTAPFAFDPSSCSLIVVQRHIDYDIISETPTLLSSDKEYILIISYTLSTDKVKEHDYYELILLCVPKLDPDKPISFRTELFGS